MLSFGRPEVVKALRSQLAQGWYLLTLETSKHFPRDTAGRDWVGQALPFMFSQAVYRIICDAFDEDRKHVIGQAVHIIDKLNIMAHYEVTGFQLNTETGQKCRRQLFQKRVVKHPHTDQLAFVRGQKRQEMLETHKDNSDPVLTFGQTDGVPLEESQLGHVLQNRGEAVQQTKALHGSTGNGTKIFPLADVWVVPYELSVDRYEDLAATGVSILSKQFHDLACCMRKPTDEEPSRQASPMSGTPNGRGGLLRGSRVPTSRGRTPYSGGSGAKVGDLLGMTQSTATGRPGTATDMSSRPSTDTSRPASRPEGGKTVSWGKGMFSKTSMRAIGAMSRLSQQARDREKALKERKMHQES
eukprot:741934-Amphidinium_carterae.1